MTSSHRARIGYTAAFAAVLLFSCQSTNTDSSSEEPSSGPEDAEVLQMSVPAHETTPAMEVKLGLLEAPEGSSEALMTPLANHVYLPLRDCIDEVGGDETPTGHYVARLHVEDGERTQFDQVPEEATKVGKLIDSSVRQCVRDELENRPAELEIDEAIHYDVQVHVKDS